MVKRQHIQRSFARVQGWIEGTPKPLLPAGVMLVAEFVALLTMEAEPEEAPAAQGAKGITNVVESPGAGVRRVPMNEHLVPAMLWRSQ